MWTVTRMASRSVLCLCLSQSLCMVFPFIVRSDVCYEDIHKYWAQLSSH